MLLTKHLTVKILAQCQTAYTEYDRMVFGSEMTCPDVRNIVKLNLLDETLMVIFLYQSSNAKQETEWIDGRKYVEDSHF